MGTFLLIVAVSIAVVGFLVTFIALALKDDEENNF